jgi:hypothetical protein
MFRDRERHLTGGLSKFIGIIAIVSDSVFISAWNMGDRQKANRQGNSAKAGRLFHRYPFLIYSNSFIDHW